VYETSVEVEVVARTKDSSKADDFDWDEACIYFMVTDRFFDGNEANNTASDSLLSDDASVKSTYGENEGLYHGGDFAGVTAKLDYLQDLGINTIWITPIVENIAGVNVGTDNHGDDVPYNAAYHGYWASDFTKLNPTLGTEEEFATMISEAHKRGIKIMVDIVVNHAGYDTEETFGDMLRSDEDVISGDDQKDSLSNLPDFKTEDADVRAQLVKWQTQWMTDYDIDYYRVDTVKHVEGTTWAALKNSVTEVNPSFKMIGEYSGAGYASNGGSLGSGEMDSDLDFDFNDQATNFVTGNISSVESFMTARNAALNNTYLTGQFLGNHDEDGFKYNLINGKSMTEEEATAASLVAATLQITAKGQPVIYYGEEIGLTGANNYPYQTNRYDFDWELVSDDNVTYQHYKKLLAIRKAYVDVFARGTRQVIASDDEKGYDVVQRSYGDENLIVAMNIKDEVNTVTLEGYTANKTYKDLYSGNTLTADKDGKLTVEIPKSSEGGTVILVAEQVEVNEPAEEQKPTGDKTQTEDKTSTDKETTTTVSDNSSDTEEEKVTSISISSKSSKKIAAGKKTTLTVDVSPETAANKDVTWSSSNTKYATVNSKGVVTTKKKGAGKTVTITATAKDGSGVKATYKITIMKNAVKSIKLTASKKKVKAGSKVTLKAAVKTTGKNANKTLTWSSSNTKYATVSKKGVVTIKKAGKGKSVKITAKATDGSGKKATIKIKISK
jgi:glycosidase